MPDAPTQRDLFLTGRREALLSPTRFDKAVIDLEGSDVNVVFNVAASMGEEVVRFLLISLNGLLLSTARGEALDRLVFDRYQLTRRTAAAAVATLTLQRSLSAIGLSVPAGSSFGTATGEVFVTQSDVAFPPNVTGPLTVVSTAQRTGASGNVAPASITTVMSALPDVTLTVTNADPAAGGTEAETDDELRARAQAFYSTVRRGTKAAIEFGALQVAGVAQSTALEVLSVATGIPVYRVQLYIADPAGQANTALATKVRESLDEYRGLGVPVQVVAATPQYVLVSASGLQFEAGANTTAVLDQARAAVLALVNGTPPGATLRRSAIISALSNVAQLIVPEGALTLPAGDLVPSTGTVIRTTADRITLAG